MLNLQASEVRRFWRVAWQHQEIAEFLITSAAPARESTFAAAAIYLGGYAAECGLKAVLLSAVPSARHTQVVQDDLVSLGHNLAGILDCLRYKHGVVLPREVTDPIRTRVLPIWDVRHRYYPGKRLAQDAVALLRATEGLLAWMIPQPPPSKSKMT